jgi:hypothetical protein
MQDVNSSSSRFGHVGGNMKIEIDDDVAQQVQSLTSIKLCEKDYYYFTDWLLRVGVGTVKSALQKHPELTLGDLVMLQYRNHDLH